MTINERANLLSILLSSFQVGIHLKASDLHLWQPGLGAGGEQGLVILRQVLQVRE